MNRKVILISIDGMRPDGLLQCGNPFVETLMKKSAHTLEGSSMIPSVTLPCHMSIFHSVTPERHGMLTNDYVPMVRPVNSLFSRSAMPAANVLCIMAGSLCGMCPVQAT